MSKHNQVSSVAPTDMAAAAEKATETSGIDLAPQTRAAVIISQPKETKSANVIAFEKLCDAFLAVKTGDKAEKKVNGRILKYAQRSIQAFGRMMNFIWAHQDEQAVLHAYQKFMAQNNTGYMSATEAMQGMNYVNSEVERNRYSFMYMLMYELVNPTRSRIEYDYTRVAKYLTNPNLTNPNGFIQYVSARMR